MFVNPDFEGLKIVSARKDGDREGEGEDFSWNYYISSKQNVVFYSDPEDILTIEH